MDEGVDRTKLVQYRVDLVRGDPSEAEIGPVQVIGDLGDTPMHVDGLRQEVRILSRLALVVSSPHPLRESSIVVLGEYAGGVMVSVVVNANDVVARIHVLPVALVTGTWQGVPGVEAVAIVSDAL